MEDEQILKMSCCDVSFPQSEDVLQATRLVLPPAPGSIAYLYNEELVFACSTGTSGAGLPDEKISFSSPGTKWRPLSAVQVGAGTFVLSSSFRWESLIVENKQEPD